MTRFIEEHRQTYGVGSICKILPIAPSVYYATVARQKKPCARSQKDKELFLPNRHRTSTHATTAIAACPNWPRHPAS